MPKRVTSPQKWPQPETDSEPIEYLGEVRPRRLGRALGLNLIAPGLGYLYCGRPWAGLAVGAATLVPILALLISGWVLGVFLLKPLGLALMLLAYVQTGMAFDLLRLCRSGRPYVLRPYNHSAVYGALIGFGVIAPMLVVANLVDTRVLGSATVTDLGMYPRLAPGDRVYFERRSVDSDWPQRGQLVVAQLTGEDSLRILRVVGLPGEAISLRGGAVLIGGTALPTAPYARVRIDAALARAGDGRVLAATTEFAPDETHHYAIFHSPDGAGRDVYGPIILGAQEFFLLGDYRDAVGAIDSRTAGPTTASALLGAPRHVWWSRGSEGIRWERLGLNVRGAVAVPGE